MSKQTAITILTHSARWKGLSPTVKRAAEAALREAGGVSLSLRERLGEGETRANISAQQPRAEQVRPSPRPSPSGRGGTPLVAAQVSITILLTNDAEIKTLNTDFRGKPKATNVLSFPDGSTLDGVTHLGDVVLAYETIAREAKEQKKALKAHMTHLVIHGVLHLLGYDHENAKDAKRMEALEINILAAMGIADPYETN